MVIGVIAPDCHDLPSGQFTAALVPYLLKVINDDSPLVAQSSDYVYKLSLIPAALAGGKLDYLIEDTSMLWDSIVWFGCRYSIPGTGSSALFWPEWFGIAVVFSLASTRYVLLVAAKFYLRVFQFVFWQIGAMPLFNWSVTNYLELPDSRLGFIWPSKGWNNSTISSHQQDNSCYSKLWSLTKS